MVKKSILILFYLGTLSGCGNLYSFMDTPSGDAQVLYKARVCFDQGDYVCAAKYYALLSSASADISYSEGAFQTVAQAGGGAGPFVDSVISAGSNGGKLITKLGGYLYANAGETTRLNLLHAYQKAFSITNTKTQGLVQFITAVSLVAELLAETADTNGIVEQSDIVQNPTACLAAEGTGFNVTACDRPTGKALVQGSTAVTLNASTTDAQLSGAPTLYMINAALSAVSAGITKMDPTGSGAGSAASGFASAVTTAGDTAIQLNSGRAYRGTLIKQDIGVNP